MSFKMENQVIQIIKSFFTCRIFWTQHFTILQPNHIVGLNRRLDGVGPIIVSS
eukprot:02583.XXX_87671_87829_1 [CDS] Oithona nana genome sequencing.